MSYPPTRFVTVAELIDAILFEMAANHPELTSSEEDHLKRDLFAIMADEDGWRNDPQDMAFRFDAAMNVLLNLRRPSQ